MVYPSLSLITMSFTISNLLWLPNKGSRSIFVSATNLTKILPEPSYEGNKLITCYSNGQLKPMPYCYKSFIALRAIPNTLCEQLHNFKSLNKKLEMESFFQWVLYMFRFNKPFFFKNTLQVKAWCLIAAEGTIWQWHRNWVS